MFFKSESRWILMTNCYWLQNRSQNESLFLKTGLSGYDAEFLSLARGFQVKLVTSDQKILKADPVWAISPERFLAMDIDEQFGTGERG